jgi:hypothetical protein
MLEQLSTARFRATVARLSIPTRNWRIILASAAALLWPKMPEDACLGCGGMYSRIKSETMHLLT